MQDSRHHKSHKVNRSLDARENVLLASFSFLILVIILLGNFQLLFFDSDFYFREMDNNGIYSKFSTNSYELEKTLSQLIYYLAYEKEGNLDLKLNDRSILTEAEMSHMGDVRIIVQRALFLFKVALLTFCVLIIISAHTIKNHEFLQNLFFYSGLTIVSFCGIMLILVAFNFDTTFTIFHSIFFKAGTWQFPPSSEMLKLLPLQLFYDAGFIIFFKTAFMGIIFLMAGKVIKKH